MNMMDAPSGLTINDIRDRSIPEPNTGCWLWLNSTDAGGYGQWTAPTKYQSRSGPRLWRAHRVAFAIANGSIDLDLDVLHKCDTPSCVNPDHLVCGTHQQNMDDMMRKGRHVFRVTRGENKGMAKITEAQMLAIRADGRPHKIIADEYGISRSHVSGIKSRKFWRHIQ